MNLSNKGKFLLDWFCLGNFGIEATTISLDSVINHVTKCLPSAINHTHSLQYSYIAPQTILCSDMHIT